ncbi:MAG TPA: DUF4442 domain-containing protein [Chitinophagales bacterium]|nr:DUF4442 domain-containing protein [Chitinophagales bacterium]HMU70422.1 DUF4442 domain-containing protein [Chitinophagales bacterium]HMX04803.1 DUF4442 domain-containing protein [Chitinophagales bacterium]HMZ88903.1 DUF4442 domain-containing protein [Chitinophagales bacterium]HNA56781.1 DUF4442 domain-containing protein [Chitinophagales bacterium]
MDPRESARSRFKRQVTGLWTFRLFLLSKLPIALITGIRIRALDDNSCTVSVPFKWLSQNPFRSVYFASQSMAAEMSTGVLSMMAIQGCEPPVSMLVTKVHAVFTKKAAARVFFTCNDGEAIRKAVDQTMASGEGVTIVCSSIGKLKDGTIVSSFEVEWSFKARSK